jgi:hypothetical protein
LPPTASSSLQRLGSQLWWNILVEEGDLVVIVLVHFLLVSRVRPVVRGSLVGHRDNGSDQDEQVNRHAMADERCRERSERMRDHDEIGPVADRLDHRVRVLGEAGGVFVARKIRRHDVMTSFPQFCLHQMPVPADVVGTVDQDIHSHRRLLTCLAR